MTPLAALDLYGRTLETASRALTVRATDGRTSALPLQRYLGPMTAADVSDWFRWAHVAADAIEAYAVAAGLRLRETWEIDGRWFACLHR